MPVVHRIFSAHYMTEAVFSLTGKKYKSFLIKLFPFKLCDTKQIIQTDFYKE